MKRFSQIIKIGLALFLAVFSSNLLPIATAYADNTTPGPNQEVYWQTLPGEVCYKVDNLSTASYLVPTPPEGRDWSKAIVKAGSEQANNELAVDQIVSSIAAGDSLTHATTKDISHIIFCHVPAQLTIPDAPTPTPPTCTASGSLALPVTTTDISWSSNPEISGAGTYDVTATALGGKLFTNGQQTLVFDDIQVLPQLLATDPRCDIEENDTEATPVAPTVNRITACGVYGSLIFAETEGVIYALTSGNGKQGAYTVTATAAPGYILKEGAKAEFTGELGAYTECPRYYLTTSHDATVCGETTVSLRNVSPWLYRVLIETKVGDTWVRVAADTDNTWMVVPGVMMVDNRGEAPDDQTGTYTVKFAEDSGSHTIRYKVSSGAEQDLYVGLPVGQWTEFTVASNCEPDVEDKKVFVCKFVGTPGVNEVLKEGENPISVSVNAIPDFHGIGSYFADAQDRSFVLGWDDGETTYDREDCLEDEEPELEVVTPASPTFLEASCAVLYGQVVLTAKTGVYYTINGVEKEAGTHNYAASSTITVVAHTEEGYTFDLEEDDTVTWTHTFDAIPLNCILGDTDVCPNIIGSQPTIPVGYFKDTQGNCLQQQVLAAATTTTPAQALPATIPATGPFDGTPANPLMIVLATILAYGATFFLYNRRELFVAR